jgi:uncharacterized protein (TIGR02284 family)
MSNNHDIAKLDDLIVTTIDSVKGYEHSADHAEMLRYGSKFREFAQERRDVVSMLQEQSRQLGGTPSDFGSAAATLHRRIEDLRRALGGGDEALIAEIERGEDYLKEEYERVLDDSQITSETRSVVSRAFASVQRGHDWASQLKHHLRDPSWAE